MISINYKKHLGLGFLFFFEIILISSVFSQIPLEYDSYWWHTRRYWLLVYPVLLIATAIYILPFIANAYHQPNLKWDVSYTYYV